MKVSQFIIREGKEISKIDLDFVPNLIFLFASHDFNNLSTCLSILTSKFESATVFGCTANGTIHKTEIYDGILSMTAVKFEQTKIEVYSVDLDSAKNTAFNSGVTLIQKMDQHNLKHILLLSDQLVACDQEFLNGMSSVLNSSVRITGGLASSAEEGNPKWLILNNQLETKKAVALAMYGTALKVGYHAESGWNSYGTEHLVTKSSVNKILEVDNQPALKWFKSHFDSRAINNISHIGLQYPIKIRNSENTSPILRMPLEFNEKDSSLSLSGSISERSYIRIMKANVDRVINGAELAARKIIENYDYKHELAFFISCTGRRAVLKELIVEEIGAAAEQLPPETKIMGFYSSGEISPFYNQSKCSYHNLTMCITTISEK